MTQGNTLSVNLCGVTLDASEAGAALFQDGDRTADSMIGRRFGRYVLTQRLGAGSMGIVYAAHDPALDRTVAHAEIPVPGNSVQLPIAPQQGGGGG